MDITQLLPLLGGDEKTASILKAASGGADKTALLTSLMGNGNPQMAKVMSMMSMMDKEKPKNTPGLNAIRGIASNDILGLLFKLVK